MKRIILIFVLFTSITIGQEFSSEFLDGTIVFKLNEFVEVDLDNAEKTFDGIGLIENIENYPEIENIFNGITVLKFERPSYFTNKRELQKIYRIIFLENELIDNLIEKLNNLSIVSYAEKEPIYKNTFIPNDSYHSGTNKWYHTLVNSEDAWDLDTGNSNIKIAIIDNAIATGHADLNVYKQIDISDGDYDATPPQTYQQSSSWSHGTHCAGLATAEINNAIGIASLGGNSELIAVKATGDSQNPSNTYQGFGGVQWACVNGANVISMSYGSENSSNAMQELINNYPEIVFVAAAGNDNSSTPNYPAAYMGVIGVGSVDYNDVKSSFSNYNAGIQSWVDIASPGGFSYNGLLSAVYTNDLNSYARKGGTSMAAPFAAGLVGLMLSINPMKNPTEILDCLISSGVDINQNIGNRIDAHAALICVLPDTDNPIPGFTASPQVAYENQPVNFSNYSIGGENWEWTFEGGSPSTYEGENPPEILYSSYGSYDVTLTISNSSSSETLTKQNYINVFSEPTGEWILQNTSFIDQSRGINYISIVDENIVWGTAYDGSGSNQNVQEFTKTNNSGDTWVDGTIDISNEGLGISMIHAYDYNKAWLVAYPRAAGDTGGIFQTTDGGSTWNRQDSASYDTSSSFANVVYFWDENVGFAQGDPINGEFELYVTSDGGNNWSQVPGSSIPIPLSGEYGYVRQIEVVGDNVWYSTNKGRLYHSADRGNNWSVYTTPISDFGSAEVNGDISFSDSNNGIIVDNSGNVYRSTNSGVSWTQITTSGTIYTSGLCFIEGTDIVYTTGSGSSFSDDGGYTWNPIDSTQRTHVDFLNEQIGWAGGFNQSSLSGGIWKWNDSTLSVNVEEIEFDLNYFPNPVSDKLSINYTNDINISVFDINGRKILQTNNKTIDFSDFDYGIYLLQIKDVISNKYKIIKILKE